MAPKVAGLARTAGAVLAIGLLPLFGFGQASPSDEDQGELTAGEATVFASGQSAFSFPLATLDDAERARFAVGHSFFNRNWVEAPASAKARDGLGPHFIARACGGCHAQDGRGAPPTVQGGAQEPPVALLLRISLPGKGAHGEPVPDPVYGDQISNSAIQGVKPEAVIRIRQQPLSGRFADGARYTLQKPLYSFSRLNYGPLAGGVMLSPRIAPQMTGVGLLEAIAPSNILDNAARQAAAGGPIKGQANLVWDAFSQSVRVGRFGWKANVATLASQTAGAFVGDMGITSSVFPDETCTPKQKDCLAAPHGAQGRTPEIDDKTFSDVVFYQSVLAPPARRNFNDPEVVRGRALFVQAQCSVCHRPCYVTAQGPFAQLTSSKLNSQRIWPYTDLLLHDMGPGLADGRPDFLANGRQWKTPPLWGLGMIPEVNGHQRLLHDGRANGILEAILWHAGEAQDSKKQVLRMSASERAALVKFVGSL